MGPVCAAMLVVLSLCGPTTGVAQAGGDPYTQIVRTSTSSDLLGRQVALAMASAPWGDQRRLAFCAPSGIQRTIDGGQSWSRVPTDGVAALAAGTDMPLAVRRGAAPSCQSVVLDPRQPDTFYVVFGALKAPQDAPPPWFAVGYYTRDAGQSWQPISALPDTNGLTFGGFVADETGVQALFAGESFVHPDARATAQTDVTPPVVMATVDGGQSWQRAPFACPASGACVRWGAPPSSVSTCNMHAFGQALLVSSDGGQRWQQPRGAPAVNACQPNELAVTSDLDVLLLGAGGDEVGGDAAPIRVSHDGGRTFSALQLADWPADAQVMELHLLPDARVLARFSAPLPGPGWSWRIHSPDANAATADRPAAARSCDVSGSALPTDGEPLRLAGDRLWWVDRTGQPASAAVADLRCA